MLPLGIIMGPALTACSFLLPWADTSTPMLSQCCATPGGATSHMRPHGDTCAAHGAQASDVRDSDNYSVFVVNYYPKTEGITWKPDTNRITPHTDETLVTLLFTSPGALPSRLPACACALPARHTLTSSEHCCPAQMSSSTGSACADETTPCRLLAASLLCMRSHIT